MRGLLKMEQETCILGNAESKEWDICSADPKYIRAFERKGWVAVAPADQWGAKRFRLPLRAIAIRSSQKRSRPFPKRPISGTELP